jgi:hypothetical protein
MFGKTKRLKREQQASTYSFFLLVLALPVLCPPFSALCLLSSVLCPPSQLTDFNILRQRLKPNPVVLHDCDVTCPCFAGINIPYNTGLAGMSARNDSASSAINEFF